MIGFEKDAIAEIKIIIESEYDRNNMLLDWKWTRKYLYDFQIIDMVADTNKVWYKRVSKILIPYEEVVYLHSYGEIVIEDSKIMSHSLVSRFLHCTLQIGKLILEGGEEKEISKYLQILRNMGLLPKSAHEVN